MNKKVTNSYINLIKNNNINKVKKMTKKYIDSDFDKIQDNLYNIIAKTKLDKKMYRYILKTYYSKDKIVLVMIFIYHLTSNNIININYLIKKLNDPIYVFYTFVKHNYFTLATKFLEKNEIKNDLEHICNIYKNQNQKQIDFLNTALNINVKNIYDKNLEDSKNWLL